MVVSVALNPSLDLCVSLRKIDYEDIIRIPRIQRDPSGKGLNIARIINRLGGQSKVLGFLGGYTGRKIKELLDKEGVYNDFIKIDGDNRSNITINIAKSTKQLKINEDGPRIASQDLKLLFKKISALDKNDYLILTGSLPPGVKNDIYARIIQAAHKKGIKTVLDADNEAFFLGIKAKPFMVKPNVFEAQRFISRLNGRNFKISAESDFIKAAEIFSQQGIKIVIISLGSKGIIAAINGQYWRLRPPFKIDRSGVGCGDGVVSGFICGLEKRKTIKDCLKLAVACGTACTMQDGSALCKFSDVRELLRQKIYLKRVC